VLSKCYKYWSTDTNKKATPTAKADEEGRKNVKMETDVYLCSRLGKGKFFVDRLLAA
jgi:hypothetical protein